MGSYLSIILLAGGLLALFLGIEIFRKKSKSTRWFGLVMISIAIWSISYGFEINSHSLDSISFWINLEYLGIATLPAFWIIFVINYADKSQWLNFKFYLILFTIPVVTILLVWTNPWHHLHYAEIEIANIDEFPLLEITPGVWYRVLTTYFYLMLAWGFYLLVYSFRRSDQLFKTQNFIILVGAFIPWLVNIFYLLGFRPFDHLDLTPFSFLLTGFVIWYGLLKVKLFSMVPIARGKVLESMHEGVLVLDNHGRIIDTNGIMTEIIDTAEGSMIGQKLIELIPDERKLHNSVEKRVSRKVEFKTNATGSERIFEISINPLLNPNGKYKGAVLLFWEITQHKKDAFSLRQQADQLEELNQLKNKLFSVISHDLRSPLSNLLQLITMLNEKKISPEEYHVFLPSVTQNLRYTSGLLENLLSWTRSQMNSIKIKSEWFDLQELIHESILLIEKQALDKGIILINDVKSKSFAFADKAMIELVLRNLLSNAIKFCHSGDHVNISAKVDLHEITVCVKDTGIGISKEDQQNLFSMNIFSKQGTAKEKGAGIGLVLCKDFIDKNNGRIWVQSEKGKGSTFCFSLNNSIKKSKSASALEIK